LPEPAISPVVLPSLPAAIFSTPHMVRLLTATPGETGAITNSPQRTLTQVPTQTQVPTGVIDDSESPLIEPYIFDVVRSAINTRVQVGFYFHPGILVRPRPYGEIYDARLFDQDGGEIPLQSTTRLQPGLAEAEFAALNAGVEELSLHLEYSLSGLPADRPLVIDLVGHSVGDSWPIQAQVKFGDLLVQLQSASLSINESGAPPDVMKSLQLELRGKNAEWHGAQLICLNIIPEAPVSEFETICGQEPGGIMTAVTLGQPVDRTAPLPVIPGTVQFQITGDFLVLDSWETTWTVK